MLTADMLFQAIDATPLTLQATETELQVVDTNSPKTVLASAVLSEISAGVTIAGNGYDVELTVDVSVPTIFGGIFFDAGTGTNRLHGPGSDQTWTITCAGAGALGGAGFVQFSGVEHLLGAADNQDTFVFEAGGSLDGVVDGGAGGFDVVVIQGSFDSVAYEVTGEQSGVFYLDGVTLTFAGMEPIEVQAPVGTFTYTGTASGDTMVLSDITDEGTSPVLTMQISGAGETIKIVNPSVALIINGDSGDDTVTVQSVDANFDAVLTINAEHITFSSTASIDTTHDVTLFAFADAASAQTGTQTAEVFVDGSITTMGQLEISAEVNNVITRAEMSDDVTESTASSAQALIRSTASIDVGTLKVAAYTFVDISVTTTTDAITASLDVDSTQTTHAGIAGGATVVVGTGEIDGITGNPSLLVEAIDTSEIETTITRSALGALLNNVLDSGFDAYLSTIDLSRDTQAYIGDGTAAVTLNDPNTESATGLVRVHAENKDGMNAGIAGEVDSFLFGQHTNTVTKDDVLAYVEGASLVNDATLNVTALEVTAENSASYTADSKVSTNNVTGDTQAYILFGTVVAAPGATDEGVILLASDTTSYSALSDDFQANFLDFPSIEFGKAAALNELNKTTQAYISDSDVDVTGGDVSLTAINNAQVSAMAKAVTVIDATDISGGYSLSLGGTFAANEIYGNVEAYIVNSEIDVTGAGSDVLLVATNTTALDARTEASTKVTGGSGFSVGIAVAFNAVGWDITNFLGATLDALIGTSLGSTEQTLTARASITDSIVNAGSEVSLTATAEEELNATVSNAAESSGGSAFSEGESLTVNAVIATNIVLSSAEAYIENSTIDANDVGGGDGNVTLDADNTSIIDATVHSATSSGAEAVGVTLAFNTIGYEAQNILFSALDALIGTDIGDQAPAAVRAYIQNSDVTADGGIALSADNETTLIALLDTNATTAAAAFFGASGMSASGLLASNMVASKAEAYISNADTITAVSDLSITASDNATINATVHMVTTAKSTNDLGAGILNNIASTLLDAYQYTSNSETDAVLHEVDLEFGDKVRLADDFSVAEMQGKVYRYMGTDMDGMNTNLSSEDYSDFSFWQEMDVTNIVLKALVKTAMNVLGLKGGPSESYYVLVVRNDVDASVESYIDDAIVTTGGNITLTAVEGASIVALEDSIVSAVAESTGGVIATNQVLSAANAYITDSLVTTTGSGDLTLRAENISQVDATTLTQLSGKESINVVVAFNAIGWDASNILFNAIDALLGTDLLINEQPAEVQAYLKNADVDVAGNLSLRADSVEELFDLTITSADLDDLGKADVDFEDTMGTDEEAVDATADAILLADLEAEFASNDITLSDAFTFAIVAKGSQWLVNDGAGRLDTILKNPDDSRTVSRTGLLNATVGNEVTSNAKSDTVLLDGLDATAKKENQGKSFTKLKFGASGMAAGGTLVSNRVSALARAYIDFIAFDHDSTEIVDALRQGTRVQDGANIYEYVGVDQVTETDFDFSTRTQPDAVQEFDLVKLHTDTGGGLAGDIYKYTNATSLTVDFASIPLSMDDHLSSDTPTDLKRGELVKLVGDVGGGLNGEAYEYLGDDKNDGGGIDLTAENYFSFNWRRLGIDLSLR